MTHQFALSDTPAEIEPCDGEALPMGWGVLIALGASALLWWLAYETLAGISRFLGL